MIQKYNILKATPAGGEPDQWGNVSFWLEIEGHQGSALVTRKPSSPLLSGPTWGELQERTSKAGKKYFKFAVKPAPDVPSVLSGPQERTFKADPDKQLSIEWQAAIKAGVEAVRDWHTFTGKKPGELEDYKREIVNTAVTFAAVVNTKPDKTIAAPETVPETVPETDDELPPVEAYEPEPVQEDIPF